MEYSLGKKHWHIVMAISRSRAISQKQQQKLSTIILRAVFFRWDFVAGVIICTISGTKVETLFSFFCVLSTRIVIAHITEEDQNNEQENYFD